MTKLLTIDRDTYLDRFGRGPLEVGHTLTDHSLLTVESIAVLAEGHDPDLIEHNLANLPRIVDDPGAVEVLDQPVGDVARNIETNGCWMVIKNIERNPDYKRLLDEALDEVAPIVADHEGGMTLREGFIFLSAPGSTTPSHTDPEHNFLLQVRGSKEMAIGEFPDAQTRQLVLEAARAGTRNIDFEPVEPTVYDLQPGHGVYVAPNMPHWVKNGPAVSVSLSITFATPVSERVNRVHSVNARLRKVGLSPTAPGRRPRLDRGKVATSRVLGRLRG